MSENSRRRAALDRIPLPHSEALRLREAGISDDLVAPIVGVEEEALPALMDIADEKLRAVLDREGPAET